jgi:hypothetical protein
MNASLIFGGKQGPAKGGVARWSPMNRVGKLAGLFYLVFILSFVLAAYLRSQVIVSGDATTTFDNLSTHEMLFRLGIVTEIVSALFFVLAAWALYVLLRSVNRELALLFFVLNLGGVAVECLNALNLTAALRLSSGANYLTAIPIDQLQAHAMLYLDLHANGIVIAQIFFATWLLPLGYLVYRSGFLPRWLGILLILDFFGDLSWFLQYFLLPECGVLSYPGHAIGFIAEVSITLWLLVKGIGDVGQASVQAG